MRRHPTVYRKWLAPQNLVATPNSPTSIALTWKNTRPDLYSEIWRDGVFANYRDPGVAVYIDTGLAGATAYSYRVNHAPAGAADRTPLSNAAVAVTQAVALVAPTNFTVTQVAPLPAGTSQLVLNWNTNGTGQIRVDRGGVGTIAVLPAGTTTFTDSGLAPNTAYGYVLFHYNGVDTSPGTAYTVATTQIAFNPPTITGIVGTGSKHITLTWANAQAGDYIEVFRDGGYVGVLPPGTTSWTDYVWYGTSASYFLRHFRNTASGAYDTANSNTVTGTAAAPAWTTALFTATQEWGWPANVTTTYFECLGGGGGSGPAYGRPSTGGGGQGGSYAAGWATKAAASVTLVIGGGGVTDQSPGGQTQVIQNGSVVVSGPGGNSGSRGDGANDNGAGGGSANGSPVGEVYHWGGAGGVGNLTYSGTGGGAAGPGGDGGAAALATPGARGAGTFQNGQIHQSQGAGPTIGAGAGLAGPAYGGGAGGANKASIGDQVGANGAQGILVLMYATNE